MTKPAAKHKVLTRRYRVSSGRKKSKKKGKAAWIGKSIVPKNGGKVNIFPKGNPGRPKGLPNKLTRELKEAILEAANDVGENGRGKDGLVGYLRKAAVKHPKQYLSLLGKVLPLQIRMKAFDKEDWRLIMGTMTPVQAAEIYRNMSLRQMRTIEHDPNEGRLG